MKGFLGIEPIGSLKETFKQNDYETEMRPCSECEQFKEMKWSIPICKKKLMMVLGEMHVYYKIDDGTCFEPK